MPIPTPSATWHAKTYGAYAKESQEAFDNAICVYNLFSSLGWSLSAICGFWGNVEAESGYNPWRWQGDNVLASNDDLADSLVGYGLVQFTPPGKYIYAAAAQQNIGYGPNFSDWEGNIFDGDSQCRYINTYADYDDKTIYPIPYDEYKTGDFSPELCAKIWLINYERPQDQSESVQNYRASIARWWYDRLIIYDPSEPIPPEGGGGQPTPKPAELAIYENKFKISFYLKPWYKRGY